MTTLSAHDLVLELPSGWDGSIYRRPDAGGATSFPVVHAANFALPAVRGDYGGGAVETMGPGGIFLSLFEFHPDSASQPLFNRHGVPLPLDPERFSPHGLQRIIAGQGGLQSFFTASSRAFALYVVLGSFARRRALVPVAGAVLADLTIGSRS